MYFKQFNFDEDLETLLTILQSMINFWSICLDFYEEKDRTRTAPSWSLFKCMALPWRLSKYDLKVIKFNELKFSVKNCCAKFSTPNSDKYQWASIMQLQIFLPFSYVSLVATRCTTKWKCSEKKCYTNEN